MEAAHRRGVGERMETCTLWECIFQHFMWVEDQNVSEKIVEIWPSVIQIISLDVHSSF